MYRLLPLVLVLLAACGSNGPRYLLDRAPVDEAAKTRVKAGTLEVMDVSLPTYAEDAEIMVEDGNGALSPGKNALWADDPRRAVGVAHLQGTTAQQVQMSDTGFGRECGHSAVESGEEHAAAELEVGQQRGQPIGHDETIWIIFDT